MLISHWPVVWQLSPDKTTDAARLPLTGEECAGILSEAFSYAKHQAASLE